LDISTSPKKPAAALGGARRLIANCGFLLASSGRTQSASGTTIVLSQRVVSIFRDWILSR